MNHPIYKNADPAEADAEAWVFSDKSNFQKYYFKMPSLKPDEVKIRVISTGLCQTDSHYGRGHFGDMLYPLTCGHEIVGEICEVGGEVTKFKIGDKVLVGPIRNSCQSCEFCKDGKDRSCNDIEVEEKYTYGKYFGGFSTHMHVKQDHVFKAVDGMDLNTIAPIMCAGMTTFTPMNKYVKKGDKIAILGMGGLGHFALQWGKLMGCDVSIFTSSHNKDEKIKELDADHIVIWTEREHKDKKDTYNIIINTLPIQIKEQQMEELLNCIKPEGVFVNLGINGVQDILPIKSYQLIAKSITFVGSAIGSIQDYHEMFDFVQKHENLKCMSEIYEWEDFPKALQKLENGKPLFRLVVNVDPISKKYKKNNN